MSQQTFTEADFVRLRAELLSSGGANASELANALTYAATLVRRLEAIRQWNETGQGHDHFCPEINYGNPGPCDCNRAELAALLTPPEAP